MQANDFFLCQKCSKQVNNLNKVFHEMTCSNRDQPSPQPPTSQESSQDYQPIFTKPVFPEVYPQMPEKYKIEELPQDPKYMHGYRCPKCTNFIPEKQFKTHLNDCPYEACVYCCDYYPNEIISEHKKVCVKQPQSQDSYSSGPPESDFFQTPQQRFQTPQRPQNSHNQFFSNSGSNSQSNSSNQSQDNPFFIFFGSHPQQTQPIIFRTITINGRPAQTSVQGNLGDNNQPNGSSNQANDPFFQRFINHGNFMRANRIYINRDRLIDLLGQLFNPNQGIPAEQLAQIEKKIFKKNEKQIIGEEEKCAICITEFEEGEEVKNLSCNHMYHGTCIDTWLVQNSHCPVCKKDLLA